jgi:hypothetical protein
MRPDALILHDGFKAIFDNLDIVEAERFITLIRRENFDYTEWRKDLWDDLSVEELSAKAMDYVQRKSD